MNPFVETAYAAAPTWLQNAGVTAYGLVWRRRRFGGRFLRARDEFRAHERFTASEWQEYQSASLRQLLVHSFGTVPHYRELGLRIGIAAADLAQFGVRDLGHLPRLEKDSIRQHPDAFVSAKVGRRHLHTYLTSGSTGTPLAVKYTTEMHQTWSAAYEARCRRWAGLDYRMSRATIGGRLVVPRAEARPPFWRFNAVEQQLYLSAFHISAANTPDYVRALNRFKPDYLVGYASAHYLLARFIAELGMNVHQPRAVLTSSETLTAEMRRVMQAVYRCPVFDAYSGVEACCLASECEHGRLHVSPDVGVIELLDEQGAPVAPGQPGEIVATGLLNLAQPLIRYRTGDWAVMSGQGCACGRQMPVIRELVGRVEDEVVTRDGRTMVRFHGLYVGIPTIREGQVVQESLDRIRLRLVVDAGFGDAERALIRRRVVERLGPVAVEFDLTDRIERTERGKFRPVISRVARS